MSTARDRKWVTVADRHARSVDEFLEAIRAVPDGLWSTPIADGKWTPAQITLHVVQSYDAITRELRTGEGLRIQTGWLFRQVARHVILRSIMWTRRLPPGAKAPKVLRPGETTIGKEEAHDRLRLAVDEFAQALQERRDQKGLQLTHHIFGSFDAVKGLDFLAVHTEHHGRQLRSVSSRRTRLERRATSRSRADEAAGFPGE